MSDNGKGKPTLNTPPITAWVKVIARVDNSIQVETPNINLDNPQNLAAIYDLLAAGISALSRTRLMKLGKQDVIVPAGVGDLAKISHINKKAGA
jgi:hypothetical protein